MFLAIVMGYGMSMVDRMDWPVIIWIQIQQIWLTCYVAKYLYQIVWTEQFTVLIHLHLLLVVISLLMKIQVHITRKRVSYLFKILSNVYGSL